MYSCVTCQGDITSDWDYELIDKPDLCSECGYPICWDCKRSDNDDNYYCGRCSDSLETSEQKTFNI